MESYQNNSQVYPSGVATKLETDITYAVWEGCEDVYEGGKPSLTKRKMRNFLERMGLPNTSGQDLIDPRRLSFEDRRIVLYVRKISELEKQLKGKRLDKEQYHKVEIRNLCRATADDRKKFETLYNTGGFCDCLSSKKWILPQVRIPIDRHVFLGMLYSSRRLGTFDLGIFNYHEDIVQAEKELIEKMRLLKVGKNWPKYRINKAFPEYRERIFNPLIKMLQTRPHFS